MFICKHATGKIGKAGALQSMPKHWCTMEGLVDTASSLHTKEMDYSMSMSMGVPNWAMEEVSYRQKHWKRLWKALLLHWCSKVHEQDQQYAVAVFDIYGMPCADVVAHNAHLIFDLPLQNRFRHAFRSSNFRFNFSDIANHGRQILHASHLGASSAAEKLFFSVLVAATVVQLFNLSFLGETAFVFQQDRGERIGFAILQKLAENRHQQALALRAQLHEEEEQAIFLRCIVPL